MSKELFDKVEKLQNILVDYSTGNGGDGELYEGLREELCNNQLINSKLPDFLFTKRTLAQFWPFIKQKYASYAERRDYLWEVFSIPLKFIEDHGRKPVEEAITAKLTKPNHHYIHFVWDKALNRKTSDPEGAITSARSLIETVCKHILDELNTEYDETFDLPKLYKLTAQQLNLAPEQHNEAIFKQILGGCQTVVEGLGALRNKLSDSHGKRRTTVKPSSRHAELAVNLAGAMTTFLLETYESAMPDDNTS